MKNIDLFNSIELIKEAVRQLRTIQKNEEKLTDDDIYRIDKIVNAARAKAIQETSIAIITKATQLKNNVEYLLQD